MGAHSAQTTEHNTTCCCAAAPGRVLPHGVVLMDIHMPQPGASFEVPLPPDFNATGRADPQHGHRDYSGTQ